ncbi:MAG: alcohol dehydrogenase catalytic domain-containing protein [Microbacterium sp.]
MPVEGELLIRVRAFGLNRSELHFRQGVACTGSFPRVPGIEAAGLVEEAPGRELWRPSSTLGSAAAKLLSAAAG